MGGGGGCKLGGCNPVSLNYIEIAVNFSYSERKGVIPERLSKNKLRADLTEVEERRDDSCNPRDSIISSLPLHHDQSHCQLNGHSRKRYSPYNLKGCKSFVYLVNLAQAICLTNIGEFYFVYFIQIVRWNNSSYVHYIVI